MSKNFLINSFVFTMIIIYYLNIFTKGRVDTLFELDSDKILKQHQIYRLVTFSFLHGGLLHLVGNILIIRNVIYPFFQDKFSFSAFLGVFILSTIMTGIALISYYSKNAFTFVGSSVGFYAFFGLMVIFYINKGWDYFSLAITQQPIYNNGLVWSIVIFFLGSFITSYWENFKQFSGLFAHNISFLIGIIIGILIKFGD
ncbi:rhomboid family intramembrane serine protease [Vagococcus bubulae]|uniref:Peptidase S54 rhomboid domain-containing protein n=1 Tax=Vagococcus bubulae TaxID=1977868 RepID=A0A429ZCW5_9ENTE|nr:rhomboid family intramembrane serine protease [Vagococcus bubulae]RST91556.1 hypothetical protein CBF36_10005 [Vagococcus bubulae]